MADQHAWDRIGRYCLEERVFCEVDPPAAACDAAGVAIEVGAFGVDKPKLLLDGIHITRMVIHAVPSNSVQLMVEGDLPQLPVDAPRGSLMLERVEE